MENPAVAIYGSVKCNGTSEGLIGLRAEAWCEVSGVKLAEGLTDKKGRFRLDMTQLSASSGDAQEKEVRIALHDRNGTLIHQCGLRVPLAGPASATVDLEVPTNSLRDHMAKPLCWDPRDAGRWIQRVVDTIEAALGQIGGAVKRPGPPGRSLTGLFPELMHFEDLVGEAWQALQGDAPAVIRLQERLDNLHDPLRDRPGSVVSAFERLAGHKDLEKSLDLLKPFAQSDHPISEAIAQTAAPLVTAAACVAEGNEARLARYVGVVVDQIAQFGRAVRLMEMAARALSGDARGRDHFRHIWEIQRNRPLREPSRGFSVDDEPQLERFSDMWGFDRAEIMVIVDTLRTFAEADCALRVVQWVRRHPKRMTVFEFAPRRACPGETVTIRGDGFGDEPGAVHFHEWHGPPYSWISGELISWTDNRIVVKVPLRAGHGIRIEPPWHSTHAVCGRFMAQLGSPRFYDHFEGTSPEILFFAVNGETEKSEICVGTEGQGEPSVLVSWNVASTDEIRITISSATNVPLQGCSYTTQDCEGTWVCDQLKMGAYRLKLVARGNCQPAEDKREVNIHVDQRPDLHVHDMEITQAIQYYRTGEHMRLRNNSDSLPTFMNLVCNKEAWVRVYVRSDRDPGGSPSLPGVSGTLWVHRIDFDGHDEVFSLQPWFDPNNTQRDVTAYINPDYREERGILEKTVNFRIPAKKVGGHMELYAFVYSDAWPCEGGGHRPGAVVDLTNLPPSAYHISIPDSSASHANYLVVRGVMVGYDGPDLNGNHVRLDPPRLIDLMDDLRLTYAMFPVEAMALVEDRRPQVHSRITWDRPLRESSDWQDLIVRVRNQLGWFPEERRIYVGYLCAGIPREQDTSDDVGGIGGYGVAVAPSGEPETLSHEIGHACGLHHAPYPPNIKSPDPEFPVYERLNAGIPDGNYPMASIGEYGLDIRDGTIYSPEVSRDIMSYGVHRWISEYHYRKLMSSPYLSSRQVRRTSVLAGIAPSQQGQPKHRNMISIIGFEGEAKGIHISSVARYAAFDKIHGGYPTGAVAELIDADGKVMASGEIFRLRAPIEEKSAAPMLGEGGPAMIQALVEDVGRGAALRIRRGRKELWRRKAPLRRPSLKEFHVQTNEDNSIVFKWRASCDKSCTPEVWIAYSADDGASWHPVVAGLKGEQAKVDAIDIPPGSIQFLALLQDGFSAASMISEPIHVSPRPPSVAIYSPKDGSSLKAFAGEVQLSGGADSCEPVDHDPEAYRWSIDGREVGSGPEIWVKNVKPGSHKAVLRFADKHGSTEVESQFEVLSPDQGRVE